MPKTPAANAININPSLTSFKPRQVLLANPKLRPNMNKSSIPALKPEQKALLLRSIAGYLKSNGFSKTLKKFLSEAEIEKDKINDSSLDLEHMCCKYLETWNYGSTNLSSQKVQDGNSKKEENADFVAGVETVSKKKKKRDNEDSHAVVMQAVDSGKLSDSNETEKQKTKEEKKNKKTSDSLIDAEQVSSKKPADSEVSDPQLHEPEKKQKDKKKKKGKLDSESLVENADLGLDGKLGTKAKESESLRESQATETTMVNGNISLEDERVKVKGKKKKKDGSVSKSSCDGDSKEIDEQKPGKNESKNDAIKASDKDATDKEKKGSKKRKRSTSEVNNSEPIDNKEVDESKRRKTEGSDKLNGSGQVTEVIGSVGTNGHTEKEIKGESDQVNIVKNGEKSALNKSAKKQGNVSAGPTTAKAFQRVKVEEVVFIDERLKDNSYWAKDGAEIGYGAKAQEVLGQVRGRDFRHEKTKKKRGSYRGGQIGLQSHSIKFNYSDEE